MALETYSDLKTEIANFLNRSDLTAEIPTFVRLAEAQMNRRVASRRKTASLAFTIDAEFMDVPSDFAGVVAFEITSPTPLARINPVSPSQLMAEREGYSTYTGKPYIFAVVGSQFRFFFAPDQSYTAELEYRQKIPALANDADTNWMLDDHPDAYLYGALLQSAPYLMDDARIQVWGNLFTTVMDDIMENDKLETDGPGIQLTPLTGPGMTW